MRRIVLKASVTVFVMCITSNRRCSRWTAVALLLPCLMLSRAAVQDAAGLLPPGGRDLITGDLAKAYATAWKDGGTAVFQREGESGHWRFDLPAVAPNEWDAQLNMRVDGAIAKGDKCVAVFRARSWDGGAAGGTANVEIHRPPEYPKLAINAFLAGPEWGWVVLPFTAREDVAAGKAGVAVQFGGRAQKLDIGGVRLLNYGPDFPADKLPRMRAHYEGRDAGHPWRAAAAERIEKLRKGDFVIEIRDASGRPVPGAEVSLALRRHAFGFGTAVTAHWLNEDSENARRYREVVDAHFSKVVFENDLKPFAWAAARSGGGGSFRMDWLENGLAWLKQRNIPVRGHYLMWAPWEDWSEKLRNDPAALRARILASLRDKVPAVGDRVCEWDALNHPAGWSGDGGVERVTGDDLFNEVFREARRLSRLPMWINEDQMFRPGRQQEVYLQVIRRLKEQGDAPDGIGNMAHFHRSFVPGVPDMFEISDRFAELVPNLQITEYDFMCEGDEELAADFTRDIMTMAFSHPAYTGFVTWGFWAGAHWRPESALWAEDWTPRPSGRVWMDLVGREWSTRGAYKADGLGRVAFRGFLGRYEVTLGGRTVEVDFRKPGARIVLPDE